MGINMWYKGLQYHISSCSISYLNSHASISCNFDSLSSNPFPSWSAGQTIVQLSWNQCIPKQLDAWSPGIHGWVFSSLPSHSSMIFFKKHVVFRCRLDGFTPENHCPCCGSPPQTCHKLHTASFLTTDTSITIEFLACMNEGEGHKIYFSPLGPVQRRLPSISLCILSWTVFLCVDWIVPRI